MLHLVQPRELFGPPERQAELLECWRLNDAVFDAVKAPKGRPTFNELFALCKPDAVNVIANSDIFFDETIRLAEGIVSGQAYALSRWENGALYDMSDSQDIWIVRGGPYHIPADYTMGKPGADNRLAHDLTVAGFSVTNPSRSIRCHHMHRVPYRSYLVDTHGAARGGRKIDRIPPPYLRVPTCSL